MTSLLLGIDVGSTVTKAVLFDLRGRTISAVSRTLPVSRPRPGWVERDANLVASEAFAVIRKAVCGAANRIAAIGITGCGNGAVFLDRNQVPLRAGILSSDTRAASMVTKSPRRRHQAAYPGQLPFLLAWVRQHEPAVARRLAHVVFWKDHVRAVLTGEIATDPTDAGAAGLLRFPSRRMLARDPALPMLRESLAAAGAITRSAARTTGLKAGTPVFTGCIDCEAAAIGSGVRRAGDVSVVAGTWAINQSFTTRPPRGGGHFLVNPSVESGRWLVLEGSPSSAANFDWAVGVFGAGLTPSLAAALAAKAPPGDLIFVPRVPSGGGAFIGLGAAHDRAALFRAVMEGVVFSHRAHLERLAVSTASVCRVVLCGGIARSRFWRQLFADGLGCRVVVPRGPEPGALGAAVIAGVGAGLWPSIAAAQAATVRYDRELMPDSANQARLNGLFHRFRLLTDFLS